jgi:hypothetical protein
MHALTYVKSFDTMRAFIRIDTCFCMHACMHAFPYVYTSFCTREFPTRTVQIYDAFTATRSRRVHRGQEFLNDTA